MHNVVWGRAEILPKIVIGLCYFSPLLEHNSSLCFLDNFRPQIVHLFTIDSCRLFLQRVSSHHYLHYRQNMDLSYPSSRSREPVREVRILFCASLNTAIGQASGFSLLANGNFYKIHVIMPVIGNKEDSIWRSSLNVLFIG